jgi:tRNA dimethylallyltransferase
MLNWDGNKKLIVVAGPTAVGKTDLSIRLAEHYDTEIISADSRQFYRELMIGTAKPEPAELSRVKHHFIDSHSITQTYDAAQFGDDALARATDLLKKFDHVIVCGGSGLYIKALIEGFDDIPETDPEIREELIRGYESNGLEWLQDRMRVEDPDYFKVVDQQNPHRLMRALEVKIGTGASITSFQTKQKRKLPFRVLKVGLELPRELLYARIDLRMDEMIARGLFREAEELLPFRQHQALQTVGYQEIFEFLEGKYDRDEAIRLLKRNSRRYAKRQLTWFKRDPEIAWFAPSDITNILGHIDTH